MRKASKVAREHGAGVGGSEGPGATAAGGRRSDDAASAGGLPSDGKAVRAVNLPGHAHGPVQYCVVIIG